VRYCGYDGPAARDVRYRLELSSCKRSSLVLLPSSSLPGRLKNEIYEYE